MTERLRLGAASALALAAGGSLLLLARPLVAIAAGLAAVAVVLALRSPVYPLALAPLPALVLLAGGWRPTHGRELAAGLFAWLAVAVAAAALRDEASLPHRLLLAPPVALTLALGIWLALRTAGAPDHRAALLELELFFAAAVLPLLAGILVARGGELERYAAAALVPGLAGAVVLGREAFGHRVAATAGGDLDPRIAGAAVSLALVAGAWLLLAGRSSGSRALAFGSLPLMFAAFVGGTRHGPALPLVAGLVVVAALAPRTLVGRVLAGTIASASAAGVLLAAAAAGRHPWRFLVAAGARGPSRHALADHPLLGAGTGSLRGASSLVLDAGGEAGAVALVLLAAVALLAARALRNAWREGRERETALATALLVAGAAAAPTAGSLATPALIWLAAGIAVALGTRVVAAPSVVLAVSRRERTARRAQPPRRAEAPAPPQARFPGAIVSPPEGATVSGTIAVRAVPADTPAPVTAVSIEVVGPDGRRRALPSGDDAVELYAQEEHVATVRERFADAVVAALAQAGLPDAVARPAPERPWRTPPVASWETTADAGPCRLRVVTTDTSGTRIESPEVAVSVEAAAPALELALADPGELLRLELELHAEPSGPGAEAVELQLRPTGIAAWRTVAHAAPGAPLAFDTRTLPDGLYDLRAVARAGSTAVESAPLEGRRIDNTPPRATILWPEEGAVLHGTVTIRAEATDLGAGVASTLFQHSADGVTWRPVIATARAATEVELDTGRLDDGELLLRVVATDAARNSTTSAAVAVRVDNAPAPEPEPEPAPAPAPTFGPAPKILWELEHLVESQPHPDPYVQAEREALLYHLRDYVGVDGIVPRQFEALVDEAFGTEQA